MENQTQQAQSQPEQKKKWHKKWWGIVTIIIFSLFVLIIIIPTDSENKEIGKNEKKQEEQDAITNQSIQNQETKAEAIVKSLEEENIDPEQKAESLESAQDVLEKNAEKEQIEEEGKAVNIIRSEMINLFPEFNFAKGTAVNGKENYVGKSREDAIFQVIGAEDNISEIVLTAAMSPESVENMEKQDEYLIRLRNKLTPNMNDYDMSKLNDTGDKVEIDGYEIVYSFIDFGGGTYSMTHTFKKIK